MKETSTKKFADMTDEEKLQWLYEEVNYDGFAQGIIIRQHRTTLT